MKKFLIITTVTASALLAGCGQGDNLEKKKADLAKLQAKVAELEKEIAETDTTKKDVRTKLVSVETVSQQPYVHYVEVQGKVDAEDNITLSAKVPGTITKINVKVGEAVHTGQVLAEIDNAIYMQNLAELDNSLELAKTVFEKQKRLYDQKIGTEIQYLNAKNTYENLQKKRATLLEQIDMTRIKSPINGTVDDQPLKLGQLVSPGMPTIRVVNTSRLKIVAEVAESYGPRIKQGNEVLISLPDLGADIKGKVSFASKAISTLNRTFNVEIALSNPSKDLRPNMVAIVKIIDYKKDNTVVIPVNYIQKDSEGEYVVLAETKNGATVARRAPVKVGSTYNDKAEIAEGLKPGDRVVSIGYQDLATGDMITVK